MEKIFQIFKNHTGGILIINEKGKIIFWNNSLEKITGISTESAKSLNIWELQTLLLRETYSDEQIESTKGLWLSGKIKEVADIMSKQRTEFLFTKKNGANNTSSVPIEQHLYSFTSEGEDFYVVSIQDISERKKAEEAIKNAYAVTEHDLRSPLNAILGFSDPNFVKGASREELIQWLGWINDSANSMFRRIKLTLVLGQIETGNFKLQKETTNLLDFLKDVRKEFSSFANKFGVNLELSFDNKKVRTPESLEINIERTLFQSVLMNLLLNAAEACPKDNKEIGLFISWEDGHISFTIYNAGEIPLEIRDRLFQKYVTSGKAKGTGIGLYSTKLIVLAHDGKIDYVSKNGETSFTASVPIK